MKLAVIQRMGFKLCVVLNMLLLCACGFHLRGDLPLAAPLHKLYIASADPYGTLVKNLGQSLQMSGVTLTTTESDAETILAITQDSTSQTLLSVSGTAQTRQYRLTVTVAFNVADSHGRTLLPTESLAESRIITIQSNQILGSSNEANMYYLEMRNTLASSIMYRLSSHQVTEILNDAFHIKPPASKPAVKSKPAKHKTKS